MTYSVNKAVTRKSIIISCPGAGYNHLPGAVKDPDNLKNYLTSPKAGSWNYPNEIDILPNPTWKQVCDKIASTYADYLFIYFSGHGFTSQNGERMICLRDGNIPDTSLLNLSPRQLIIVDACRTYIRPGISGVPQATEPYAYADGYSPAREIFDKYIANSLYGKLIVHATESGTKAYDERFKNGGAFTLTLLKNAMNISTSKLYSPVFIEQMLPDITDILVKNGYYQFPCITYSEGCLQVPFAIDAPQIIPRTKNVPVQKEIASKTTFGDVLAGVAIAGLLYAFFSDNNRLD